MLLTIVVVVDVASQVRCAAAECAVSVRRFFHYRVIIANALGVGDSGDLCRCRGENGEDEKDGFDHFCSVYCCWKIVRAVCGCSKIMNDGGTVLFVGY